MEFNFNSPTRLKGCNSNSSVGTGFTFYLERMASYGMLRRVALVRTDDSEELSASIIRVTGIGELGTTLAVTNNRRMLQRYTKYFFAVASYG
jgi:hypothetical protein